jgi:hypothetical protein
MVAGAFDVVGGDNNTGNLFVFYISILTTGH